MLIRTNGYRWRLESFESKLVFVDGTWTSDRVRTGSEICIIPSMPRILLSPVSILDIFLMSLIKLNFAKHDFPCENPQKWLMLTRVKYCENLCFICELF